MDEAPAPAPRLSPVGRFFAGLLITVGALMVGLCGLCTLAGLAFSQGEAGIMLLALVVGGIPIGIGALLVWAGRKLWRG